MERKNYYLLLVFMLFSSMSFAQVTVTGTVLDKEDNTPLPGVTVVIQNTVKGTITDLDGKYTLEVDSLGQILEFKFVGMETYSAPVTGASMNASLGAGVDLNEVLIVAYGKADKKTFTGSAGVVKAEQLKSAPVANVISAMQGTTSGVQIQATTGDPGSQNSVKIRGIGSLNSNSSPLYVVDGVPVSSGNISALDSDASSESSVVSGTDVLSTMNPDDIESVTVLKDASATSIYGARAANGVILITTKKGVKGKAKVNIDYKNGISVLPINRSGYKMLGAADIYKLYNDANIRDNEADPNAATIADLGGSNPYNMDKPYDSNGKLDPNAALRYDDNWQDVVFRTAKMYEANINVSGGNDILNYYTSAGYLSQEGIVKGSDFERLSLRNNMNINVSELVKLGLNQSLSYINQNRTSAGSAGASSVRNAYLYNNAVPIYQYDKNGNIPTDSYGDPVYNYNNPVSMDFNPLFTVDHDVYNTKSVRSLTNTYLDISLNPLVENLKFRTDLGMDYSSTNDFQFYNPFHGNGPSVNGRGYKYASNRTTWSVSNKLFYKKDFNDYGVIDVLVGQEALGYKFSRQYAQSTNYAVFGNEVISPELANGSLPQEASSKVDQWALSSYLGRINYELMDKYYLDVSWRNDGSSRFGPSKRRGNFYSVGASWRVSEEKFMKNISWINNLKLRGSYGTSGNDQIGNDVNGYYQYRVNYTTWNYDGQPGYNLDTPNNPELTWENKVNATVGVDFQMFSNKLSGSVEWYNAGSNNLLYDVPVSMTTGFQSITQNYASLRNRGLEMSLNYRLIDNPDFKWDLGANYTTVNNVIVSLPSEENIIGNKIWKEGGSVYNFYLREWAGVDAQTGAPLWNVYDEDNNFTKTTSDYNEATQVDVGSGLAKGYGGVNSMVTYKNWSLNVNTYFSVGGKLYDGVEQDLLSDGASPGYQTVEDQLDAWKKPGDITNVPKFTPGNTSNSSSSSTRYLHDASYFKIKGVMISYNVDSKVVKRMKLSRLGVYLSANNLLTWTKSDLHGYDPEVGAQSISYYNTLNYNTPNPTSAVVGVKIGL